MLTDQNIKDVKKLIVCKKEVFLSPDVISDGDPVKGCYKFAISSDNNFFKNTKGTWTLIDIGSGGDSFWAAGEADSISNTNSGEININSPFIFQSLITGQEQMLIIDNDGAVKVADIPIPKLNNFLTNGNKFIKLAAGVIRPTATATPASPITWAFIDDAHHTKLFFTTVAGSGSNVVVSYPTIKKVITFIAVPDEALTSSTVQVGVSADVSSTSLVAYRLTMNAGKLTGNTTTWTNSGLSLSVLNYNTTSGLTYFTPTISGGTVLGASNEIEGTQISYVGTNNYRIRRQYSGLGGIAGFYLVDNTTNAIVTGNLAATDVVSIMVARPNVAAIPAATVAGNGYPADIYNANSNYWLAAVFETYIYSEPLSASSIKVDWQVFNIGGTFATNYRITRALNSAPGVETTIYSGAAFTFTDTGLTTGTAYYYRLYVTISAVESLLTYEIVSTL